MEFHEAQDIDREKHHKECAPMGATTNCALVYYGTAWDDQTLLQRTIEARMSAQTDSVSETESVLTPRKRPASQRTGQFHRLLGCFWQANSELSGNPAE